MTPLHGSLAASVALELTRVRFKDKPQNLPFPSAWRVVWEGITIKNGATVLVIIIVFTTPQGNIESELLDVPIS